MSSEKYQQLKNIDYCSLWHPFTQHKLWFEFCEPLIVERGEGVELVDVDRKRYLDGVSSLWCNVHGHGVAELTDALKQQADKLCHSTLLGLSHVPILELTQELSNVLPTHLTRMFFCDSGTAAVEAALRMAMEWSNKKPGASKKARRRYASLGSGYHGDTLGAVGVGYLKQFHHHLQSVVVQAEKVPPPHVFRFYEGLSAEASEEASIAAVKSLFAKDGDELAAFIIEPLVQGAAGIWIHQPRFIEEVSAICREHEVLLIADEVATGFGKTGRMFSIENTKVKPDIMVVGKGLTGGYLPLSAAVAREEIFEAFLGEEDEFRTFYYGQTYGGNPLAAAVARENLRLFQKNKVIGTLGDKISHLESELAKQIAPLAHVDEVRSRGLMVAIELTKEPGARVAYPVNEKAPWRVIRRARELGVIIRPLGNVIILMPALAMDKDQLTRLVGVTAEAIQHELGE